jgi:hypothetical protein
VCTSVSRSSLTAVPQAAQLKAWVCGCSLAGIAGSNPAEAHGCLSVVSVVLSGRGFCDGLITRQEESYRECMSLSVIKGNSNLYIYNK